VVVDTAPQRVPPERSARQRDDLLHLAAPESDFRSAAIERQGGAQGLDGAIRLVSRRGGLGRERDRAVLGLLEPLGIAGGAGAAIAGMVQILLPVVRENSVARFPAKFVAPP